MPMADFHEVAPDGEVYLILHHPDQLITHVDSVFEDIRTPSRLNFRRSHQQQPQCMKASRKNLRKGARKLDSRVCDEEPLENEPVCEESEPDPEVEKALAVSKEGTSSTSTENCVQIRVSSKHLALASSYFKRNLNSGMSESHTLSSEGRVDFRMNDEDPEAMLIVVNVIHGRFRQVPRSVDLDMLTKIAILVDYLECHEAIEPFSDMWIDDLKGNIATTYSKALIQWLCISLIFHKESQFTAMTCTAIRKSKGSIQTLGLPIRESVIEKVNLHRCSALDRLFSALGDLLDDLRQDRAGCTFECHAMRYGILTKELDCRGLLFPRPQIPFHGYSFENTAASVRNIGDPEWRDETDFCNGLRRESHQSQTCQLSSNIASIINSIDDNLKGLSLSDFV